MPEKGYFLFNVQILKMSTKEPFLEDLRVIFQRTFIPSDPTFNTSEVQIFHCRIPKSKLVSQSLNPAEPSVVPSPTETYKAKSRLIDNNSLQPSKIIQEKLNQTPETTSNTRSPPVSQNPQPEQEKKSAELAPQRRRKLEVTPTIEKSPEKPPPPENPPANNTPVKQQPSMTDNMLIDFRETITPKAMQDFWTIPLKNQEVTHFIFYRKDNEFGYVDSKTKELQIRAIKRHNNAIIMLGGEKVAEVRQQEDDTFFVYTTETKPYQEMCAMKLNNSYAKEGGPKLFELYIPALKKRPEGQRFVYIEGGETSGLVVRVEQQAREAIVLKTRVPQNQGSNFDLSFDELFRRADQHNFIIYHDSSPRRIVASLGCVNENLYKGTATYPLCPLQIFFTCCGVHLLD